MAGKKLATTLTRAEENKRAYQKRKLRKAGLNEEAIAAEMAPTPRQEDAREGMLVLTVRGPEFTEWRADLRALTTPEESRELVARAIAEPLVGRSILDGLPSMRGEVTISKWRKPPRLSCGCGRIFPRLVGAGLPVNGQAYYGAGGKLVRACSICSQTATFSAYTALPRGRRPPYDDTDDEADSWERRPWEADSGLWKSPGYREELAAQQRNSRQMLRPVPVAVGPAPAWQSGILPEVVPVSSADLWDRPGMGRGRQLGSTRVLTRWWQGKMGRLNPKTGKMVFRGDPRPRRATVVALEDRVHLLEPELGEQETDGVFFATAPVSISVVMMKRAKFPVLWPSKCDRRKAA